eukprot:scaffold3837_cov110-Isochrysis_galbana.AAC.8
MLALNLFWLTVWGCKIAAARMILLPILLESHSQLVDAFPMPSDNEVESANSLWLARIQPRMLIRAALQLVVWGTGAAIYVADTLGWYQLVLSLWGGVVGISRYGVAPTRPRHFFGSVCFAEFKRRAYAKLLPSLAASEEEMAILQAGLQPKSQTLSRTSTCEPHTAPHAPSTHPPSGFLESGSNLYAILRHPPESHGVVQPQPEPLVYLTVSLHRPKGACHPPPLFPTPQAQCPRSPAHARPLPCTPAQARQHSLDQNLAHADRRTLRPVPLERRRARRPPHRDPNHAAVHRGHPSPPLLLPLARE